MSAQRKGALQPSFPHSDVHGQAGPHTAQHSIGFLVVQSRWCPRQGMGAQRTQVCEVCVGSSIIILPFTGHRLLEVWGLSLLCWAEYSAVGQHDGPPQVCKNVSQSEVCADVELFQVPAQLGQLCDGHTVKTVLKSPVPSVSCCLINSDACFCWVTSWLASVSALLGSVLAAHRGSH